MRVVNPAINAFADRYSRNDAPSGLSLDLSHLGGLKALESFIPSESGAESPTDDGNVIQPVPGQQAAVTFGAGLSTTQVNEALGASGLFTVGAAHGTMSSHYPQYVSLTRFRKCQSCWWIQPDWRTWPVFEQVWPRL